MPADGKLIKKRHSELSQRSETRRVLWDYTRTFLLPEKFDPGTVGMQDGSKEQKLFDQTACDAVEVNASGQMSLITPSGSRWLGGQAPEITRKFPEVRRFYHNAALTMWEGLAQTNFNPSRREMYRSKAGFGLGAQVCLESMTNDVGMFFKNLEVGSFVVEEDEEGNVDTFIHKEPWGIRQIHKTFGEEAMTEPMAEAYKKFLEKGINKEFEILWAVYPREDYDATKFDFFNLPVASVYIDEKSGKVLSEKGFLEFPGSISRYLKGGGTGAEYGYCPTWRALPSIKGANFMQMLLDFMGEKAAIPSLLIPDYLEGLVDTRAGGPTIYKPGMGAEGVPREWMNQGRYDIGADRVKARQDEINRAFNVDLFRMFEGIERQMTAREVNERAGEKIDQVGPIGIQQMHDDRMMMKRIFGLMLRKGKFGPIPPRAIIQNRKGVAEVPDIEVIYTSKLSILMKYGETANIERTVERAVAIAPLRPDVWDTIDLDVSLRLIGENEGVPSRVFVPEEVAAERRAAAAQRQQQAEALAATEQIAGAAGKVGIKVA